MKTDKNFFLYSYFPFNEVRLYIKFKFKLFVELCTAFISLELLRQMCVTRQYLCEEFSQNAKKKGV